MPRKVGNDLFMKTRNSSDGARFHHTQNNLNKIDNMNPYRNQDGGGDYGGPGPGLALKIVNNDISETRSMTPVLKYKNSSSQQHRGVVTEGT